MQIVRKIPDQLSGLGVTSSGQYILKDYAFDYAISGLPFLSATQDNRPYNERMAEIRKQQFDNFAEPGEQSLQGWWLRSQSNFSGGAGILYQDPDTDNQFNVRFADSLGVDPWTSGSLQLLKGTALRVASGVGEKLLCEGYVTGGNDAVWYTRASELRSATSATDVQVIAPGGGTITALTGTGNTYIVARSGTGIWKGTGPGAPVQIYTSAATNWNLQFVKDRLIGTSGPSVYQLLISPVGPPAAIPTATYTHQDPNWAWKSITDGPTAIYVAGDSGMTSQIHKFSVVDNAGVPALAWAGVTATMPGGEIINTIYSYIGSFVGIATNKGFRVGEIDQNGDISYGPLLFSPTGGCQAITGFDRFMFVGSTNAHDGNTGMYRVDLGNSVQEQTTRAVRYAYARDIYYLGVGAVVDITNFGNSPRKVFMVQDVGVVFENTTTLVTSGYLKTGRIRFNTEEPKLYKFFSIRTPSPLDGNVSVDILTEGGGDIPYITYSPLVSSGIKDVAISNPTGPQNWMSMKFTLFSGTDPSKGGILNGWQMKALPGSIRQRTITQIFELFDEETDRTGQRIGYDGYSRDRFELFKSIARAGDVVIYQELQEGLSALVVIDDWQYTQTAPPGPNRGALGGYLTVVMRTVAEST